MHLGDIHLPPQQQAHTRLVDLVAAVLESTHEGRVLWGGDIMEGVHATAWHVFVVRVALGSRSGRARAALAQGTLGRASYETAPAGSQLRVLSVQKNLGVEGMIVPSYHAVPVVMMLRAEPCALCGSARHHYENLGVPPAALVLSRPAVHRHRARRPAALADHVARDLPGADA